MSRGNDAVNKVRTDESGATGDEPSHGPGFMAPALRLFLCVGFMEVKVQPNVCPRGKRERDAHEKQGRGDER
jgi:hypothetical protein